MKKYIILKDTPFETGRILEVLHETENCYDECVGAFEQRMKCKRFIEKKSVEKESEFVEEICDEFLMVCYNQPAIISIDLIKKIQTFAVIPGALKKNFFKTNEIYGCIWVRKPNGVDLKSVARLKGILPNGDLDWELL